jgi:hypothetical protein
VGYALAASVWLGSPPDIEDEDWLHEVLTLQEMLRNGRVWGALEWFNRHYPQLMAGVPPRRRDQFLRGAIAAYENQEVKTPPTA